MKRLMVLILSAVIAGSFVPGNLDAQNKAPEVEVVFVLDTTGSMSALIAAAKAKIWSIANTLASAKPAPKIKMGLIGYRDRGDQYVTKFTQLTDDLDAVYDELMGFSANGGGDTPESVNQAIHEAIAKTGWSKKKSTYRVVFLVGDAPPKMNYQNDVKYDTTCKEALRKGIIINTIQCGNIGGTEKIWRQISGLASGEYFRVSQSGSAVAYTTPYDKKISKLSLELDKTRVYYGKRAERAKINERLAKGAGLYSKSKESAIAQRASFNAKSSGSKNFLGTGELVDAVNKGRVKLDTLNAESLPGNMKKMSKSDRKKYITAQAKKRKNLRKEILNLDKKRQVYIRKQVAKEKGKGKKSLDMKIFKSIKKQGAARDLEYEELQY
ncbi:MAG: VWA domain-containing protein [bacterium]|nr:VWA domain-containing protein [bacterium]